MFYKTVHIELRVLIQILQTLNQYFPLTIDQNMTPLPQTLPTHDVRGLIEHTIAKMKEPIQIWTDERRQMLLFWQNTMLGTLEASNAEGKDPTASDLRITVEILDLILFGGTIYKYCGIAMQPLVVSSAQTHAWATTERREDGWLWIYVSRFLARRSDYRDLVRTILQEMAYAFVLLECGCTARCLKEPWTCQYEALVGGDGHGWAWQTLADAVNEFARNENGLGL